MACLFFTVQGLYDYKMFWGFNFQLQDISSSQRVHWAGWNKYRMMDILTRPNLVEACCQVWGKASRHTSAHVDGPWPKFDCQRAFNYPWNIDTLLKILQKNQRKCSRSLIFLEDAENVQKHTSQNQKFHFSFRYFKPSFLPFHLLVSPPRTALVWHTAPFLLQIPSLLVYSSW